MERLLDSIDSPADLKRLSITEMETLAGEIRQYICEVISKNGGHLAPSLGVVELTLALHATFSCPPDRIVWDVGHQSYTHKIITGRRKEFATIRLEGGLSGFPKISENECDAFGVGHAATAISAALGLATARDIRGSKEKIIAVVGDGALTSGLSFEGLNNAGASHRDLIVVLNDNKMSISSNVGGLSRYLTDVISNQTYNRLKKDIWDLTGYLPLRQPVRQILNRVERSLKALIIPGSWFENLGFRYFGPIDGHDLPRLMQIFAQLKTFRGPLLLHVYTTKGKGYCYAEQDATRFHGVSAFELANGKAIRSSKRKSYSDVMGDALVELAERHPSICAITAAMTDSTGLAPFAEKYPDRFFDVGIAEEHAVTFACGLAAAGLKPFVAIYSSFLQRSYDNVIHDAALQKLPVVFCLDRAGVVGEDGPTHHGVFDISFLRHIPNLVVMAPKDENELRDMLAFAAGYSGGPVAIRYPRGAGTAANIRDSFELLSLGRAESITEGKDCTIIAVGEMVASSIQAAEILKAEKISAGVVNMRFIRPLDTDMLDRIALQGKPLMTVEENTVAGGFGSAVMEYYTRTGTTPPLTMIGLPDAFIGQASRNRLLESCGLDPESLARTIRKAVKK